MWFGSIRIDGLITKDGKGVGRLIEGSVLAVQALEIEPGVNDMDSDRRGGR